LDSRRFKARAGGAAWLRGRARQRICAATSLSRIVVSSDDGKALLQAFQRSQKLIVVLEPLARAHAEGLLDERFVDRA
jgi:hypothetical protein